MAKKHGSHKVEKPTAPRPKLAKAAVYNNFNQKLDQEQKAQILVWFVENPTLLLTDAQSKIKEKWGITYSASSISKLLKATREERSIHTRFILKEELANHLVPDLEKLSQIKNELFALKDAQLKNGHMGEYYKSLDRFYKFIDLGFELAGANERTTEALGEQAKETLLEKLEQAVNGAYRVTHGPKETAIPETTATPEDFFPTPYNMKSDSDPDPTSN